MGDEGRTCGPPAEPESPVVQERADDAGMRAGTLLHVPRGIGRRLALSVLAAAVIGCALRLAELYRWLSGDGFVNGEAIVATNDAYHWMTLAGSSSWMEAAMAIPLHVAAALKCPMGTAALLLPSVLFALALIPTAWLLASWRVHESAMVALAMVAVGPAFLDRTRIGYYDTDLVSLALTLGFVAACVGVLERPIQGPKDLGPLGPLAIVLIGWTTSWAYSSARPMLLATGIMAAGLGITSRHSARGPLLPYAVAAALSPGWPLRVLLLAVMLGASALGARVARRHVILVGLAMLAVAILFSEIPSAAAHFFRRFDGAPAITDDAGRAWPSMYPFVGEAQPKETWPALAGIGGSWAATLVGALGLAVLWKRTRSAALLLPMVLLGLAGVRLGQRFEMHALPPVAIGVAVVMQHALERLKGEGGRIAARMAAVAVVTLGAASHLVAFGASPVVTRRIAADLIALRETTPADARLWTSWELGYAAEYYARREVAANGGTTEGIGPLVFAKSVLAESPEDALRVLECGGAALDEYDVAGRAGQYPAWSALDDGQVDALLDGRVTRAVRPRGPQFLVIGYHTIATGEWIAHFGSWSVEEGGPRTCRRGLAGTSGDGHDVMEYYELGPVGVRQHRAGTAARGGVAFRLTGQKGLLICPGALRDSVLVSLLVSHPSELHDGFELVLDDAPALRVFRLGGISEPEVD